MRRLAAPFLMSLGLTAGVPGSSVAQEGQGFLAPGTMAPDIEVVGATRYGVLEEPVKLSDFRGETVVLAFFFKARTGG